MYGVNGISEWVIGVVHADGTWFYAGKKGNKKLPDIRPGLKDAKRYDDTDLMWDDIELLRKTSAIIKIIEIQKCPKCGKEFIGYPAISREDNETEICPECGVKEAMEAYLGSLDAQKIDDD